MVLIDVYGRPLTHMRISITSRCNYRCFFCHREGESYGTDLLRVTDFEILAEAAKRLGIKYFKLTGGEPLIRPDVVDIVRIFKVRGLGEVSLVTNGYYLPNYVRSLVDAGLDRVNVSIHSLSREKYRVATGVDALNRVLHGIELALDHGLRVKVNVVALRGINDNELKHMINYFSERGINVAIIELIPLNLNPTVFSRYYVSLRDLALYLEKVATKVLRRELHNRPVYILPTGTRVELIMSYRNPEFCSRCTRIRVTHDAKLKTCLFREPEVDLAPVLYSNLSPEEKVLEVMKRIEVANKLRRPYFTR
ncbi:MAG: GTP 3',8-cyclase MoaA [Thermoprotei archaeon]|nr:MAG: GTP 3',8-cyclase MoaA [Thermoprotei archaeon]